VGSVVLLHLGFAAYSGRYQLHLLQLGGVGLDVFWVRLSILQELLVWKAFSNYSAEEGAGYGLDIIDEHALEAALLGHPSGLPHRKHYALVDLPVANVA